MKAIFMDRIGNFLLILLLLLLGCQTPEPREVTPQEEQKTDTVQRKSSPKIPDHSELFIRCLKGISPNSKLDKTQIHFEDGSSVSIPLFIPTDKALTFTKSEGQESWTLELHRMNYSTIRYRLKHFMD